MNHNAAKKSVEKIATISRWKIINILNWNIVSCIEISLEQIERVLLFQCYIPSIKRSNSL